MANHNQNGGRSTLAEDSRSSWRPRDPSSQGTRGRQAEDDRGDRAWRDHGVRDDERGAGEREPRRWDTGRGGSDVHDEDRDPWNRHGERHGQGQSGYGAGRPGDDRSPPLAGSSDVPSAGSFEERYRDGRYRDLGTEDRFASRRPSYGEDRTAYDLDRYAGQGGRDFEAERRALSRAGYGYGYGERTGYPAGSYSRGATGYGGPAQDLPPRSAGPEPHVHHGTGPHRGKGPSGYQRSDERIRELVCESLTDDDQIDATHIEVAVGHGEVTLSGTVEDRRVKRDAEDCAWSVAGVRDVQNRLRVDDRSSRGDPPDRRPPDNRPDRSSNRSIGTPVGTHAAEVPVQDRNYHA